MGNGASQLRAVVLLDEGQGEVQGRARVTPVLDNGFTQVALAFAAVPPPRAIP